MFLLTPKFLKIAFSGSYNIELEKSMTLVDFKSTISTNLREWFGKAIYKVLNAKRMRHTIFIRGLGFFGGSRISVVILDRGASKLESASVSSIYYHTAHMKL